MINNYKLLEIIGKDEYQIQPGELLFIRDLSNSNIKEIIEWTVVGLILKKQIIFKKFNVENNREKDFFLELGSKSDLNFFSHEKLIFDYVSRKDYTSLSELVDKLAIYCSGVFRFFSKGFRFEKLIWIDLYRKKLTLKKKYKLLFNITRYQLSDKGKFIRNYLINDLQGDISVKLISLYSKIYNSDYEIFKDNYDEFFLQFRRELNKAITYQGFGSIPIVRIGQTYPLPKRNN